MGMRISEITLYNRIRRKFGDEEAADLVDFVKSEVQTELGIKTNNLLIKEDKAELIERINGTKEELIDRISSTREELKREISDTREELKKEISDTKAELKKEISDTKAELKRDISDTREELIDRIHKSKTDTIVWIVAVGILQFILSILTKRFL